MAKIKKKVLNEIQLEDRKRLIKCFKRFLKENGRYSFIMSYLFTQKRSMESFFKTWEAHGKPVNILGRTDTLGPSYFEKGYDHWEENICGLSEKWNKYVFAHGFLTLFK